MDIKKCIAKTKTIVGKPIVYHALLTGVLVLAIGVNGRIIRNYLNGLKIDINLFPTNDPEKYWRKREI